MTMSIEAAVVVDGDMIKRKLFGTFAEIAGNSTLTIR